jgi:uncharacterized surface protein with fasciclin (FAS1) repeats
MTRRTILPIAILTLTLLLAAAALIACGASDDAAATAGGSPSGDVAAALKGDDQLSQYAEAFAAAGVTDSGPFTVFAASDDALTAAGVTLSADAVKASVIEGQDLARADLKKGSKNDSMLADNTIVTYTGSDGSLYVNNFKVVGDPITAGNGTVYIYDGGAIQPKE